MIEQIEQRTISSEKFLGINIDHIATIRNARDGIFPNLNRAVEIINNCNGIKLITIHLREDRRHIRDADVETLCKESPIKINLEIACTEEMTEIAIKNKPYSVCIVPEKREEMTTESGLDVITHKEKITKCSQKLKDAGILVSLFLDPDKNHITTAKEIGVDIIEIHTGKYANANGVFQSQELERITIISKMISKLEMQCHAGHGLNYNNITNLTKINEIELFNIGHFLIGESIYCGLEKAVNSMYHMINA